MRETLAQQSKSIITDETPMHVYQCRSAGACAKKAALIFSNFLLPPYYRDRLISIFLAILELIKERSVWLEQPEPFGSIWLTLRDDEAEEQRQA